MKKIIFGIIIVLLVTSTSLAQISNLTDRELLIQLNSRMEYIQKTVARIETNSNETSYRMNDIEKRVTKNENNIDIFCIHVDEICSQWNKLLALFVIFISGIFIAIFRTWWTKKKE